MRGKLGHGSGDYRARGITPAYAGKTSETDEIYTPNTDHPRVCGENKLAAQQG